MASKTLKLIDFYKDVNGVLKGTFLKNEDVEVTIKVKLPEETRQVELIYTGTTLVRDDVDNRAKLVLSFETKPE